MFIINFNINLLLRIFCKLLAALFLALAEGWGDLWTYRGPLIPCLSILKKVA